MNNKDFENRLIAISHIMFFIIFILAIGLLLSCNKNTAGYNADEAVEICKPENRVDVGQNYTDIMNTIFHSYETCAGLYLDAPPVFVQYAECGGVECNGDVNEPYCVDVSSGVISYAEHGSTTALANSMMEYIGLASGKNAQEIGQLKELCIGDSE